MRSSTLLMLVVLAASAFVTTPTLARTQAPEATAEALYQEAGNYPRKKQAELRAQGKQIDRETNDRILREQRELASKHAARLAARPNLAGADLFYLGRLYDIAYKGDEVIIALRGFLALNPAPEG
ncbi:MAG: hypothetical protein ACREAM_05360, partial [Blastocatellia bacterium]